MFERSKQGSVHVIAGDDPLNVDYIEDVQGLISMCVSSGQPRIVFNLERVPLIDSAGLEVLLDARDRCAERGGTLVLAAPNSLCRDILDITKVAESFEIFESALAGSGSFAQ